VAPDGFFLSRRVQLITLAMRDRIPAAYWMRDIVAVGGLMSYGASLVDVFRHVGVYAGNILKGAKPSDLPVQRSTKFELAVNLTTAKALGLTVPQSILLRADDLNE
jgi:putative tryptophan/tyrosine transport system substrate-binding protein